MILLNPDPTFEQMVRLTVPGQPEPVEVPMTFRHMTAQQASEWFAAQKDRPVSDAIGELITGWSGVMDADGKAVAFSQPALAQLLENYQPASMEVVRAWQIGLTESRVKN